ncbi:MAG: protein translocase subunit SecF [Burkholderiales bacterium]|nr:protein translocase subunit SecF [Phycisphaerae bacterium]
MELFKNTNYDFLGKKWPFIIASLVLTAAGLGSLIMKGGPKYGIDFKGGALVYVNFADSPPEDKVRAALSAKLGGTPDVQRIQGTNELIIGTDIEDERVLDKTRTTIVETLASTFAQTGGKLDVNNASQQALVDRLRDPLGRAGASLSDQDLQGMVSGILGYRDSKSGLIRNFDELRNVPKVTPQVIGVLNQEAYAAPYAIRNVEVVGPKVGAELQKQAVLVTLSALGGMLIYIAFRFEWIYGVAAVLAVLHDTIITIGLFSIFDKELSLTVVAAVLTLVGYSMNDTIVVFDRVRENLKILRREPIESLINKSLNQTLSRTILTSGLTFLTALALLIFGGPVLHGFSFALVIGIIIGTYSSVFIASPILIFWQDFVEKRKSAAPMSEPRRSPAKVK